METIPRVSFLPTDPASQGKVWGKAPHSASDPSWPPSEAWTDVSLRPQFTDSRARCTRIAVCDDRGQSTSRFFQGQRVHFFFEFEILQGIQAPCGGIEFTNESGIVVHGKSTYQFDSDMPPTLQPGVRVRFRWSLNLRISPGTYRFTVGLAGSNPESYQAYVKGPMSFEEFRHSVPEHCRLRDAGSFEVTWGPTGKLLHHGAADLPGSASACVVDGRSSPGLVRRAPEAAGGPSLPTVFHVTHWKAGSQWIHKILKRCCPDAIIEAEAGEVQVRCYPIQPGRLYPTVYMSKHDFDQVVLPEGSTRFVVIRDLRDTLVSAFFSFKSSHPVIPGFSIKTRQFIQESDIESGLLHLMDHFLEKCATIQLSWLEARDDLVLKYEDLLTDDLSLLEFALIDHCRLPVTREAFREAVLAARFEALTGGRTRGCEDVSAHERKGIAGDWRNHFTERVKRAFKARYGGLLVAAGYETDLSW